MLTSKEDSEALSNLNDKLLEIMNERGILAAYVLSSLSKITVYENASQFKLIREPNSNRVNDLVKN